MQSLQRTVDKLIDSCNERARANDCLQSELISARDNRLRMLQSYEGEVRDCQGDMITVIYKVEGDLVEQTYERSQFLDGRLPPLGTRLVAHVHVAEIKPVSAASFEESSLRDTTDAARGSSLTGPIEF